MSIFSGPSLVDLNLSAQNLEPIFDKITLALPELQSLACLQLAKCRLTRSSLDMLANSTHPTLRSLDIQANVTGDIGPQLSKIIENFKELRDLKLCRMKLTDLTFETRMDLSQVA